MKRAVGVALIFCLAAVPLAVPSSATAPQVSAHFTVRGQSVAIIEQRANALLTSLDPSATWQVSYDVGQPVQFGLGGGKFGYRWTARVTASTS